MTKAKTKKYVTLNEEGMDFRTMAAIMTNDFGHKMNHATARNQLIIAIGSLLNSISGELNANISQKEIKEMVKSQEVHEHLSDVLFRAYTELKSDGEL